MRQGWLELLGTFSPAVWKQKMGANESKECVVGGDVSSPWMLQGQDL